MSASEIVRGREREKKRDGGKECNKEWVRESDRMLQEATLHSSGFG